MKTGRRAEYQHANPNVVNEIVQADLCVRCGACEPSCPFDIIRFDANHYPFITNENECRVNCVRCLKVCPGGAIDFNKWDDQLFGQRPHPASITGMVRASYVAFSRDDEVRKRGASGGFVTQLLTFLLERNIIDGALVLGTRSDEQGWRQHPFLARTVDEIRSAAQSKYLIEPMLRPLGEMERIEGNYAVVALPCHVHALRQYMKVSPKLRKRLKLIIGLYCNIALEPHLLRDVCKMTRTPPSEVTNLEFRGGQWPGGVHVTTRTGGRVKLLKHEEMKDEFNTFKLVYTPDRCNMCIDFGAEYADIAVGDPWLRDRSGEYAYPDGRTTVITRTEIGERLLQAAVVAGQVSIENLPLETYMMNFEKAAKFKRDLVPQYLELRRRLGLPVPEYGRDVAPEVKQLPTWRLFKGWRALLVERITRLRWIRITTLRLAQLRPALSYFRWNRARKARKFAASYERDLPRMKRLETHAILKPRS